MFFAFILLYRSRSLHMVLSQWQHCDETVVTFCNDQNRLCYKPPLAVSYQKHMADS